MAAAPPDRLCCPAPEDSGRSLLSLWTPCTVLLVLALTLPAFLEAQPRPIRFEQLSTDDGLSQSIVNCFLQDSTGFLWIGTQDGLNRYDGYTFEVFRHDIDDPTTLANDFIMALAEDPEGNLWIGTEGGGLARWRRAQGAFDSFQHDADDPGSLSGNRVLDLVWDAPRNVLWIGTLDSGLNRFDPTTHTFERFRHDPKDPNSLAADSLGSITLDRHGILWVGTSEGLDRFDPESGVFEHFRHDPQDPTSLADNRVQALLEDHTGALWVGTKGGLHRRDATSGAFERFLHLDEGSEGPSHNWVRALLEDRDRRLWVATDGGLDLWQPDQRRFVTYRHDPADPNSLGSSQVLALLQDRSGVLWISTVGAGISKWHPGKWSFPYYWSQDAEGAGSTVLALSEDPQGALWVGTFGGGLERIERPETTDSAPTSQDPEAPGVLGRRTRYRHDPSDPNSLSGDRVTALLHDRQGVLWVGTLAEGLDRRVAEGRFRHHTHDPNDPNSLSSNAVSTLFEDREGRLWVGTYGGGLGLHRGDGTFTNFQHDPDDPTSFDRVLSIAQDASGRLWTATDGGGLCLLDPATGRVDHFMHDPTSHRGPSSDELNTLHIDARDRLWIGTEGRGLDLLERLDSGKATFRNFSRANGLPDDTLWGIRSDLEGFLWLSTNNGLARFDPETETFTHYTASHGLQDNEFMLGAHYRNPRGELFFGGVNGFNAFFPDRIERNTTVPPIALTGFSKYDQAVDFERPIFTVEAIPLSHRDRFLTFEFAALDYTDPAKNEYRYQLEGFDEGWVSLGNQRHLTFPSLEPGDYVLRVQGSNNDGVWSETDLAIRLQVTPPVWKTWWFRAGIVLLLGALLWGVYEARIVRIRRNSERLQRLVAARTHDLEQAQEQLVRQEGLTVLGRLAGSVAHEIRNPLGVIQNAVFFLRMTQRVPDAKGQEHLELIEREIDRSDRIIVQLLDYAEDTAPDRQPLVVQDVIDQVLADRSLPDGITLERSVDPTPRTVQADRRQLARILDNLIRNAVQAMPDGGTLGLTLHHRPGAPEPSAQGAAVDRSVVAEPVVAEPVVILEVVDEGPGISDEALAKVFEPLYTTKLRGIGLGLALSRRDAQRHGGRLEVESTPGEGSIFRLILPLDQPAEPHHAA